MTTTLQTYPKYKESSLEWTAGIPSDWEKRRFKFIFNLIKRPVKIDDEIITAFRDGTVTLRRNRKEDGFTIALKEIGYQGVRRGDLVISGMDGFAGAIGISDSNGKATPVYSICQPIQKSVFTGYYKYLLRVLALSGYISILARGIRERSTEFKWNTIGNILLVVPDFETQKNIADFLDEKTKVIDELVAKKEKMIELLREKRAALITHAVTKGLDPKAKMKPSGIEWLGEIPDAWEIRRGKFVFKYEKELNYKYQCDHILALTLKGVMNKEDYKARSLVPTDYATYQIFYKDDLVFKLIDLENYQTSRVGIVPIKGIMSSAYLRIVPKDKLISKYYYWSYYSLYLDGIYNFLGMGVRSTLNQWDLLSLSVQIPSVSEQKQIVDYLDTETNNIKCAIALVESQIDQLKEYRSSLIYSAVTGKIKI